MLDYELIEDTQLDTEEKCRKLKKEIDSFQRRIESKKKQIEKLCDRCFEVRHFKCPCKESVKCWE